LFKILITGSSGFVGREIYAHLSKNNDVSTLNRKSGTYQTDLSKKKPYFGRHFDIVIHCAGLAHQNESLKHFLVNVNGTKNLLGALEANLPSQFVFISTIAVYGVKTGNLLNEDTPILASDSYGMSKIQAEAEVVQWCAYNNVKLTILRLPLVVGKNAPGNLKDMIRAIKSNYYFNISGGIARKSMVLAEDVAKYILKAAEVGGIFNLTDGCHPNFNELSHLISIQFGKKIVPNMPLFVAKILAFIGDKVGPKFPINSNKLMKITSTLTFNDSKAREAFGWNPTPVLKGFKIHE
jgi:nucleoside-diphosphate-sugar epimerase